MEYNNGVISITDPVIAISLSVLIFLLLITALILAITKVDEIKIGSFVISLTKKKKKTITDLTNLSDSCKDCPAYLIVKNEKREVAKAAHKISRLRYVDHRNRGIIIIDGFINSMNNKLYNEYVISVCKNADNINDILKITEYFRISHSLNEDISKYLKDRLEENSLDTKLSGTYSDGNYILGEWDRYKININNNIKSLFLRFMNGEFSEKLSSNIFDMYSSSNKIWDKEIQPLLDGLLNELREISIDTTKSIKVLESEYKIDESDFF